MRSGTALGANQTLATDEPPIQSKDMKNRNLMARRSIWMNSNVGRKAFRRNDSCLMPSLSRRGMVHFGFKASKSPLNHVSRIKQLGLREMISWLFSINGCLASLWIQLKLQLIDALFLTFCLQQETSHFTKATHILHDAKTFRSLPYPCSSRSSITC